MKFEDAVLVILHKHGPMTVNLMMEKSISENLIKGAQKGPKFKNQLGMAVKRLRWSGYVKKCARIQATNEAIYTLENP